MRERQSQAHVKWYCRYHVVIVPKYRRKSMFGVIRRDMGQILKELCERENAQFCENQYEEFAFRHLNSGMSLK